MARAIWIVALAVYVPEFVLVAVSIAKYVRLFGPEAGVVGVVVSMAPTVVQIVAPLLWLLIIRLVLEVCLRLVAPDTPSLAVEAGLDASGDGR